MILIKLMVSKNIETAFPRTLLCQQAIFFIHDNFRVPIKKSNVDMHNYWDDIIMPRADSGSWSRSGSALMVVVY